MAARLPKSGRPFRFLCTGRMAERLEVTDRPPKCTVSLRWVQAVTLKDVDPPLAFFRGADIANDPIDLDRQAAGAVIERNHGNDTSGGFHGADSLPPPCRGDSVVGTVFSISVSAASSTQASGSMLATHIASPIGLMLDIDNPPRADHKPAERRGAVGGEGTAALGTLASCQAGQH